MVPVEDRIDSLPLGGSTSIWTFIFKSLHRNTDIPVKARQKQRQSAKRTEEVKLLMKRCWFGQGLAMKHEKDFYYSDYLV
jgi:hypothetical protein